MKKEVQAKDQRFLGRDRPAWPIEITGSTGSYLFSNKKKYIDFLMGWNIGNIGWNNKTVINKIKTFKGPNYVLPHYLYQPWTELAELLANITPGKLVKSFRATGGTEANEIALQAAMAHTGRQKFVSIEGAYYGHSVATMSISSSEFRKRYKNLLPGCHKIKPPLNADAGRQVERLLKKEDVAAFISEPIILNLGILMPDKEFFDIVSDACKKYGTLLIMDEVATGFGRTGKLFASEHYNLKPDIMTLAKALTGGYGGLGAAVMTKKVAKSMEWKGSTYSTFGWMPLGVEGAIANVNFILKNKLWKNAQIMGNYFEKKLSSMPFKHPVKEIRVKGLAIAVEFKKKGYAQLITKRAEQKGALFCTDGPSITLFPALNIDKRTADKGLKIIERCL